MPEVTMPDGTIEEQVAWLRRLPLEELREFARQPYPRRFGSSFGIWLERLIAEKEHFEEHLQDDCPLCQHQKHLVEGCHYCARERRHG